MFGLGRLPPTPPFVYLVNHYTVLAAGFDATYGDGSRYRAGRGKGVAVRDSSRPRVFLRKLGKQKLLV